MRRAILTLTTITALGAVLLGPFPGSGGGTTRAQDVRAVERIGRDRPLLVPTSDGPRARINELKFVEHAGKTWLLAASSDKAVHRWEVASDGGLVPAAPLRWPMFRGLRGSIYTMDDLGNGIIAVAGVGVKSSQVSLLHLEGNVPPRRLVDVTQARQNVWAISADPLRQLLYVGEGGGANGTAGLLMWSLRDAEPKVTCCATRMSDVKFVAVSPDGAHVVAAGPLADRTSWGFFVWSTGALFQQARSPKAGGAVEIRPVQETTFTSEWPETIRAVDWLDSTTWIAATVLGYARGTVGGEVDKAGFQEVIPGQWQAGFKIEKGRPGEFGISNANPLAITLFDATANRKVVAREGERPTFGKEASVSRIRENESNLGPWSGANFAGFDIAFVPYVVDLDCTPRSNKTLSSIWNDGRAIAVLETRGVDGRVTARTPLEPAVFRDITCMTLSPDGRFAAAAGPELITVKDHEVAVQHVRVWSAETGRLVAKFPDGEAPAVGGPIASLVTSRQEGGDTLVYQYGILPNVARDCFRIYPFVVDAQEPVAAADADLAFAGKSTRSFPSRFAVPLESGEINVLDGSFAKTITGRGVPMLKFSMSKGAAGSETIGPFFTTPENLPNCCVRFTSNGRSYAAVGLADGIQVWDLAECAAGRGYRGLARSFYGHDAQVMSLDVSTDGTQLYSASADGTLCGWSLVGLDRRAEFGLGTNGTAITNVTNRLPGYYAGFEQGMTVTGLQIQGRRIPAAQLATCLGEPLPGLEYFFEVRTANDNVNLQTPVGHDPLWTFFPRHDGQSVMWTPEGYYDTSELNGTDTIEWVVNLVGPLGQSDEVVVMAGVDQEGSKFRDSGVLTDVFRKSTRAADGIPAPPAIALTGNVNGCNFSATPIGREQQVVRLDLYLNGRLLRTTNGSPVQLDANALRSAIRSGTNTLAGVVETRIGAESFRFRQLVGFEQAPQRRPRRVHFVGVGVEKAPNMPELPTVVSDVTLVAESVRANRTAIARRQHPVMTFADAGTFELLVGGKGRPGEPTAANVRAAFGRLDADATPDDLAIVVLSSHGELLNGEYVFHTTDQLVRQAEITELIQQLPCRTLLILDTCHAGAGADKSAQIEQFARVVNGPMVLTACKADETAVFDKETLKHGFFLAAVAEGLSGERIADPKLGEDRSIDLVDKVADSDADGWLSVAELGRYVQQRTGVIKGHYDSSSTPQTPQVVPSIFFTDSGQTPLR